MMTVIIRTEDMAVRGRDEGVYLKSSVLWPRSKHLDCGKGNFRGALEPSGAA